MNTWYVFIKGIFSLHSFLTILTVVNKVIREMNSFHMVEHIVFLWVSFPTNGAHKYRTTVSHFSSQVFLENISIIAYKYKTKTENKSKVILI